MHSVYELNGIKGLRNIAKAANVSLPTINRRLAKGMSLEQAVNTPDARRRVKHQFEGANGLSEIAELVGCSVSTLALNIRDEGSLELAVAAIREKRKPVAIRTPSLNPKWAFALRAF